MNAWVWEALLFFNCSCWHRWTAETIACWSWCWEGPVAALQRLIQGKPLDLPEESGRGADGHKKGPPSLLSCSKKLRLTSLNTNKPSSSQSNGASSFVFPNNNTAPHFAVSRTLTQCVGAICFLWTYIGPGPGQLGLLLNGISGKCVLYKLLSHESDRHISIIMSICIIKKLRQRGIEEY